MAPCSLGAHPLEAGVGPQAVKAQQQALLQGPPVHALEGRGAAEGVAEADAQVGLLEHVEQAGHRPPRRQVRLEGQEVRRLGLGLQLGQRDPAAGLGQDLHVLVLWQGPVQDPEGLVISWRTWAMNASASWGSCRAA